MEGFKCVVHAYCMSSSFSPRGDTGYADYAAVAAENSCQSFQVIHSHSTGKFRVTKGEFR